MKLMESELVKASDVLTANNLGDKAGKYVISVLLITQFTI